MPFGPLFTPSIALGLLAAHLRRARISSQTLYLTVPYAKAIGIKTYNAIANGEPGNHLLLGDWIFRDSLFGPASLEQNAQYLASVEEALLRSRQLDCVDSWDSCEALQRDVASARSAIPRFLEDAVNQILDAEPAVVGFTTIFQQNVASLAAARRIKSAAPNTTIVFGGANCEDAMGAQILKEFDFVDYVVSGEGDAVFVPLVEAIISGEEVALSGVLSRGSVPGAALSKPIEDLDALPYPEYSSYFEQVRAIAPEIERSSRLLYESSRGCWWGERSHCTFCGLNGTTMEFRSKSAVRAYEELQFLVARYAGRPISVVDNILNMKYFDDFIPMLTNGDLDVELFYEVKANLKKRQLYQLRDANILMIQPGVESLDDDVLQLMRKGVSALQNVQLLKWCLEIGIDPHWNLIWGFPKEPEAAYNRMAALVPLISHLPPPKSFSPIRLDRFSPNFNEPENHGIENVRPFPAYDFVYDSIPPEARAQLAYYFTFDYADRRDIRSYTRELESEVVRWQQNSEKTGFFSVSIGEKLLLCDLRDPSGCELSLLDPIDAAIYRSCDVACTLENIRSTLVEFEVSPDVISERVARLVSGRLLLHSGKRYLSLAIEAGAYVPHAPVLQRFKDYLAANSSSEDDSVSRVHVGNGTRHSVRSPKHPEKETTTHGTR